MIVGHWVKLRQVKSRSLSGISRGLGEEPLREKSVLPRDTTR